VQSIETRMSLNRAHTSAKATGVIKLSLLNKGLVNTHSPSREFCGLPQFS